MINIYKTEEKNKMRSIKIKQQTIQFHSFMHKLPSEESTQDTTTANSSQTAKKKEMQLIKHNKDCKTYIQKTEYKSHRILVADIRASKLPNPFNLDSQCIFLIIFIYKKTKLITEFITDHHMSWGPQKVTIRVYRGKLA